MAGIDGNTNACVNVYNVLTPPAVVVVSRPAVYPAL